MPKQYSVTLSNPSWPEPVNAKGAIPDDDWQRLRRFAEYANELRGVALLNRNPHWSYGFAFNQEEGVKAPELPPPIEVRELAMVLRPFILQDEGTYFYRMVNLLDKHFAPAEFRQFFKAWKDRFSGRDGQQLFRAEFGGIVLNSEDGLKLWLNAYQFHRDEDKRAILDQLKNSNLPFGIAEGLFIEMLTCQAEAVLLMANFINAVASAPGGEQSDGGSAA